MAKNFRRFQAGQKVRRAGRVAGHAFALKGARGSKTARGAAANVMPFWLMLFSFLSMMVSLALWPSGRPQPPLQASRVSASAAGTNGTASHGAAPAPGGSAQPQTTGTSPAPAVAPSSTASNVLLSTPFTGPNRLVTTAYAYWNNNTCAPRDPAWVVTSGSWFIYNGAGYSGKPSVITGNSPCQVSYDSNGSYQLRMNTVRSDFTNTDIQFDYDLAAHGGAGGAAHSYDGLHIWTRHESQYALYAASIGRWDGEFVIKKKLPVDELHCPDPANDGCYVDISPYVKRPDLVTPGVWRHAEIRTTTAGGTVHIDVLINGQSVISGVDAGAGGRIIPSGAVGIRSDKTEFYLKNFVVSD